MKSINLMKNVGRFTPPKIPKSDLPSNHLYDLPPPPPKSPRPSLICPQIVCTIYPQIICTIYLPEIAKSDLPSNHLYDLPSNCLYNLPPWGGKSY